MYRTLRILHCNINRLSSYVTRIKLDTILELSEIFEVQSIALQDTKLKEHTNLKIKGCHIFRTDRHENGGGGLAFIVRDVNHPNVDTPQFFIQIGECNTLL